MAQQPAVVIIARHGPRLDAADREWHLSTPTPYDPPLTYGGWNQSRALGVRIASLLYAREQSVNGAPTTTNEPPTPAGVLSRDFASGARSDDGVHKREKQKHRRHKVVVHTSPFLRCVQTSVAISAGIAQFVPATAPSSGPQTDNNTARPSVHNHGRIPVQLVMSPRNSGTDYGTGLGLLPIPEPKHGFGHEIARRVARDHKKHRRSKLRVDAFLGEWMNPEYFEQITPPPPSALMVATAKAELMQTDAIDVFTPTITTKSSHSSLWGGGSGSGTRPQSRDGALEDWDDFHDALNPPSPRRDRTSSYSSVGSNESDSSRRLGRRGMQSTLASTETTAYVPPVPTYAVATQSNIPKGYVAHARNNCVNVDYQWDSSRDPQDWGTGGEYGEEWSLMHRRFRKGLTNLIYWYSQHNADDRGEDALGLDQAEHHHHHDDNSEEDEDLVIILVTHGAGCNALIGALTGQPVLMDVGMASLTMATRKEDAPPASILVGDTSQDSEQPFRQRRGSIDIGLTAMYEMKIVASSEHLRPGYDPMKFAVTGGQRTVDPLTRLRPYRGDSLGPTSAPTWSPGEEHVGRNSMTTALGSVRRPTSSYFPPQIASSLSSNSTSNMSSDPREAFSAPHSGVSTPMSWSGGLWTPPEARTPQLAAHYMKDDRRVISLNEAAIRSTSASESTQVTTSGRPERQSLQSMPPPDVLITADNDENSAQSSVRNKSDQVTTLESLLDEKPPQALSRGLSKSELWRTRPTGDVPKRDFREGVKRRWTFTDEQQPS